MAVTMFGKGIPVGRRKNAPAGCVYYDTTGGPAWVRIEDPVGTLRWRPLWHAGLAGVFEHFLPTAGVTLPAPWAKQDTSAAGSPTTDYVANADGGNYVLKFDTTNEVETLSLYFGDHLFLDVVKRPVFGARFKIEPDVTGGGGLFAAGDKLVCGLGSARNATLDNMTTNLWIMSAGANLNLYAESDDGTTDSDDVDTGVDYVANTFIEVWGEIDGSGLAHLFVDDAKVYQKTMAAATGNLQFFFEQQKAAAANKDHRTTFDWACAFSRS